MKIYLSLELKSKFFRSVVVKYVTVADGLIRVCVCVCYKTQRVLVAL